MADLVTRKYKQSGCTVILAGVDDAFMSIEHTDSGPFLELRNGSDLLYSASLAHIVRMGGGDYPPERCSQCGQELDVTCLDCQNSCLAQGSSETTMIGKHCEELPYGGMRHSRWLGMQKGYWGVLRHGGSYNHRWRSLGYGRAEGDPEDKDCLTLLQLEAVFDKELRRMKRGAIALIDSNGIVRQFYELRVQSSTHPL